MVILQRSSQACDAHALHDVDTKVGDSCSEYDSLLQWQPQLTFERLRIGVPWNLPADGVAPHLTVNFHDMAMTVDDLVRCGTSKKNLL